MDRETCSPTGSKSDRGRVRVVVFCSGPRIERGVKEFLCRLEDEPKIDLLAVYCQSRGRGPVSVMADLFARRGILAIPIILLQSGTAIAGWLMPSASERAWRRRAEVLSKRIEFLPDIHDPAVLRKVRELAPDIGLVYGAPILKPALFEIPRSGTLGIHHGRLPDYRGKKTTFWAIYNGEPEATVTIQKITAELDLGEVLKEGSVPIGGLSYGKVWDRLEALGLKLFLAAIFEATKPDPVFIVKPGKPGKLYYDPKIRDLLRYYWSYIHGKVSRQPRLGVGG